MCLADVSSPFIPLQRGKSSKKSLPLKGDAAGRGMSASNLRDLLPIDPPRLRRIPLRKGGTSSIALLKTTPEECLPFLREMPNGQRDPAPKDSLQKIS